MRECWLIALLGLLGWQVAEAATIELRAATFVPGKMAIALARSGVSAFGAEPEQTFPGCVTAGNRLFQADRNLGFPWPAMSLQEVMTLLLEARRAQAPVTVTYYVAPDGRCLYRGLTY